MSYAIYIPARNVAHVLKSVVDRLPSDLSHQAKAILIVNNGSTDRTQEIAEELQKKFSNVVLIHHKDNTGYGGSQKSAYQFCIENKIDSVVMVHGDGQYAPELAGSLLIRLEETDSAMVFGSRMTGDPIKGGMPLLRFVANILLTRIGNLFLGTSLSELHSGFRAYRTSALQSLNLEKLSNDYHFDTEIIAALVGRGQKIAELTIPTHYGTESRSIPFWHGVWYALNVIRSVIAYRLRRK